MILYNIKKKSQELSFKQAVIAGIGESGGLFMPKPLKRLTNIEALLTSDFVSRSTAVLQILLDGEMSDSDINDIVATAFNFPIMCKKITEKVHVLELFHGPTFAFKDFGARFMAQVMHKINKEKITIVTATSGDTGAAIAHAFYNVPNVDVYILYPYKKISSLQEQLFCTLGGNINTIAIKGDFDACQALVKKCFQDDMGLNINSGNSINICRVIAQILYYFEAAANITSGSGLRVAVPCGNFGNLTAGLFAKSLGLNIESFIAATNENATVPRYLREGIWQPSATIATISNAMDVSDPNNWPRIEELCKQQKWDVKQILDAISISEATTKDSMRDLHKRGYVADPHTAIAFAGLESKLKENETGVFLATAHPAKFKSTVDSVLDMDIELPYTIEAHMHKKILSTVVADDYSVVRKLILS